MIFMLPETIYNFGIILVIVGIVVSILIFVVLHMMKKRLQAELELDYGTVYCEAKKRGK